MINPDRWLQSCAEDTEDYEIRWEEENEMVLKEIRQFGVNPADCDLHDKVYPLQKELMQALDHAINTENRRIKREIKTTDD
jgi:hypothetical protein